jgi:hypothetical protein
LTTDDVALLEPVERHLHLDAVAAEPDVSRLLAEGVEQQLLGVVLRPLDQDPAEAEAPAEDCPGEDRQGPQTADHHDRVEHVDAQPLLLEEDLARRAEGGDRRIGEGRRRHRQQRREGELRRRRQRQRGRADRQVQVEYVERRRVLGVGQGRVEDLEHLRLAELPRVVVDLDRAPDRVGAVLVDPQDAHQFPLDGLAKVILAVEHGVLQEEPAVRLGLDFPARHDRVMAIVIDDPPAVPGRDRAGDLRDPCLGTRGGVPEVGRRIAVGARLAVLLRVTIDVAVGVPARGGLAVLRALAQVRR